ncbi:MAG: hypothetical protein ABF679_02210 [Lentilactobacillus diolivorans]|uniref:Streptococcal hemagglutinin protein n=2 Tax=Lentilactobacillus diolivorans TaxID=179838 RepID=A0A0R1S5Y9_9LACO|nr:hypothetical protein [Lentilactobacillus diolivorans]KRL62916.1 hypothetical protein FC85_GL001787 [Lentilactobacillus diolivorans DSM 14421]MDH5104810.1 hypothetical protein [Lentilactobacillus diolivorans]GEP23965.1 hypothetical protein LDI01_15580 [Lentilactobacillus diolivorans]
MNRHDNEPQYKKYDFNSEQTRRRRRKKQYSGWWFALLILLIALAIAFSVNWFLTRGDQKSSSSNNASSTISKTIKKSEQTIENKKSKGALTNDVEKNRIAAFNSKLKQADNNGITSQQRQQFQQSINQEVNKTVKSREQTLLNNVGTRQPAKPSGPKAKKNKTADQFSANHTFASVQDAKNWANATKQQWLKAGYVNYTITSNSQGYYILQFVK